MSEQENRKWQGGQCSGTMYHGGMEHYTFLNKVFSMYFSSDRFPALADMNMNNRSVYATLERLYDAHLQEALDLMTAGSASREEARLLGINKGAPVMRMSTDRQGLPVEYSKVVFHAERYQFVARMQRTG